MAKSAPKTNDWPAHPKSGRLAALAAVTVPLLVGLLVLRGVALTWTRPVGFSGLLGWWVTLTALGSASIAVTRRVLQPVAALGRLLPMALTFPDRAPSRWRLARQVVKSDVLPSVRPNLESTGPGVDVQQRSIAIVVAVVAAELRRDGRWSSHRLTRKISDRVATAMEVEPEDRGRLRWAVLAHDVGHLLDDNDNRHVEIGAATVAPLRDQLWPWIQAIDHHHENFDGTGWPRRLKGDEISVGGRIIAVANGYGEALTGPGRHGLRPVQRARNEVRAGANSKFDPAVVAAFSSVAGPRLWAASWKLRLAAVAQTFSINGNQPIRRVLDASIGAVAAGALLVTLSTASGSLTPTSQEPAGVEIASAGLITSAKQEAAPTADGAGRSIGIDREADDPSPSSSIAAASTTSTSSTSITAGTTTTARPRTSVSGPTAVARPAVTSTMPVTTKAPITTVKPATPTLPPATTSTAPLSDCERARSGATDLTQADLRGCDLSGMRLSGVDASGADLTGALMNNATIIDSVFDNASLKGAKLQVADVKRTTFFKTDLTGAGLSGARFSELTFDRTKLTQAYAGKAQFEAVAFIAVNAESIVLSDAVLLNVESVYTSFQGARFKDATMRDVKMNLNDLRYSNWRSVDAKKIDLVSSSVVNSDFRDARLLGLGLASVDVKDANFGNADLSGTSGSPKGSELATFSNTTCGPGDIRDTSCWE